MIFILLHYLLSFVTVTSSAHQCFLCRVISSSAAISVPHSVRVRRYYGPPGGGGGPSLGDRPPGGGGGPSSLGWGRTRGGEGYYGPPGGGGGPSLGDRPQGVAGDRLPWGGEGQGGGRVCIISIAHKPVAEPEACTFQFNIVFGGNPLHNKPFQYLCRNQAHTESAPPCKNNALVTATAGVVSAAFGTMSHFALCTYPPPLVRTTPGCVLVTFWAVVLAREGR